MKTLQRILPIVVALGAIGGAIYHVRAQGPVRPVTVELTKPSAPLGSTLPPSGRYAGNVGAIN